MKLFVDTGAWIALADKNDQYHDSAADHYTAPHPAKKGFPPGHVASYRYLSIPVFDGQLEISAYNGTSVKITFPEKTESNLLHPSDSATP